MEKKINNKYYSTPPRGKTAINETMAKKIREFTSKQNKQKEGQAKNEKIIKSLHKLLGRNNPNNTHTPT